MAVEDLGGWTEDDWDNFAKLTCRPPQIVDPNNMGQYMNDQPYIVSVGLLKFLKKASTWIRAIGSWTFEVTHFKMSKAIIENFSVNSAVAEKKFKKVGGDDEVPKVGKMGMSEYEKKICQDAGKQQSCRDDIVGSLDYLLNQMLHLQARLL